MASVQEAIEHKLLTRADRVEVDTKQIRDDFHLIREKVEMVPVLNNYQALKLAPAGK